MWTEGLHHFIIISFNKDATGQPLTILLHYWEKEEEEMDTKKNSVHNQKGNEIFTADDKECCRYNNIMKWNKQTNKYTMQKWTKERTNERMTEV